VQIESIRLHHFPATRSARAKWILYETVGDAFETVVVDLYKGAQYKPEFLVLNPNHNVPVLEIRWTSGEMTTMLESAAMVTFLADAFPDKGLAPPANALSPARADYLQMIHFSGSWMDMMLWQIRSHEHLLPRDQSDARTIERYRSKFAAEVEPQLLQRFETAEFVCGPSFTAADCIIGHNVAWARLYGLCKDEVFGNYLSRLARREGFCKAFADAQNFSAAPPLGKNA
jgi:glutathione S-transferase